MTHLAGQKANKKTPYPLAGVAVWLLQPTNVSRNQRPTRFVPPKQNARARSLAVEPIEDVHVARINEILWVSSALVCWDTNQSLAGVSRGCRWPCPMDGQVLLLTADWYRNTCAKVGKLPAVTPGYTILQDKLRGCAANSPKKNVLCVCVHVPVCNSPPFVWG